MINRIFPIIFSCADSFAHRVRCAKSIMTGNAHNAGFLENLITQYKFIYIVPTIS